MEKKDIDLKYYAKVHSIESFGTGFGYADFKWPLWTVYFVPEEEL